MIRNMDLTKNERVETAEIAHITYNEQIYAFHHGLMAYACSWAMELPPAQDLL